MKILILLFSAAFVSMPSFASSSQPFQNFLGLYSIVDEPVATPGGAAKSCDFMNVKESTSVEIVAGNGFEVVRFNSPFGFQAFQTEEFARRDHSGTNSGDSTSATHIRKLVAYWREITSTVTIRKGMGGIEIEMAQTTINNAIPSESESCHYTVKLSAGSPTPPELYENPVPDFLDSYVGVRKVDLGVWGGTGMTGGFENLNSSFNDVDEMSLQKEGPGHYVLEFRYKGNPLYQRKLGWAASSHPTFYANVNGTFKWLWSGRGYYEEEIFRESVWFLRHDDGRALLAVDGIPFYMSGSEGGFMVSERKP